MIFKIKDALNRTPIAAYLALFLVYYFAGTLAITARYEFNLTSLLRIGAYYAEQNDPWTPEGAIVFTGDEAHGGNGYDGQIFYYYARTFFEQGVWPSGFQTAYRAPRAGYPVLVAPFSLAGSDATVVGMILVQLLLFGGSILALNRMLRESRRYLLLFYIISPFAFQSYLLLVSDTVMISLVVIGIYFYRKGWFLEKKGNQVEPDGLLSPARAFFAFLAFSLAVLTKESSLFLLFPLGLVALAKRDLRRILLMLSILLPALLWQAYLKEVHGIVPAGVLKIFLSPLDGIFGIFSETIALVFHFLIEPSTGGFKEILKLSARWILLFMIPASVAAVFVRKGFQRFLPYGLATLLVLFSVVIADYYYFWSVYENISRMLTLIVPVLVLLKNEDEKADTSPFFALLFLLAIMVFLRTILLTPDFPYREFHPLKDAGEHSNATTRPGNPGFRFENGLSAWNLQGPDCKGSFALWRCKQNHSG